MSWGFRHFKESEFDRPEKMDHELLARLDYAREQAGIPFVITSDYREPGPDEPDSAHHLGKAVDIRVCSGMERFRIVRAALNSGFKRIGVYDKHIHLDVATAEDGFPMNVIWEGKSR